LGELEDILSLFLVQGSDWLAKLAGDWEAAGEECGEGVRRVILRFFLTEMLCAVQCYGSVSSWFAMIMVSWILIQAGKND
jgi:hypothetical protein